MRCLFYSCFLYCFDHAWLELKLGQLMQLGWLLRLGWPLRLGWLVKLGWLLRAKFRG
jgi:hypothetical protein